MVEMNSQNLNRQLREFKLKRMKTNKFLTLLVVGLTAVTAFIGCSKDDVSPTDAKPAISVTSPTNNSSVATGTNIDLTFTASSNNELRTVTVKRKVAGGSDVTILNKTISNNITSFSYDSTFVSGPIGTEIYTITVLDKKDLSETKTITVNITDGFGVEKSGFFYHIEGSLKGAYDLVADVTRGSTEANAEKDMVNSDAGGSPFTGSWSVGTGNATTYVKVVGFDYTNATSPSAIAAYNNGAKLSTVAAPVSGDVYIAKLRNGTTYAIILIDAVSASNNECSCNNTGKLTFKYKKTE